MYESQFGARWTCFSCNAAFFDMNKGVAICPKCGADQAESPNRYVADAAKNISEEEELVKDIDLDLDEDDGGGDDDGIESFEELEERMNEQGEEEDEM